MLTTIGVVSIVSGFAIMLLAGISGLMENETIWTEMTPSKLMGEERAESLILWFDSVMIQDTLDFIFYESTMGLILVSVGVFILVVSMVVRTH